MYKFSMEKNLHDGILITNFVTIKSDFTNYVIFGTATLHADITLIKKVWRF